MPAGQIENPTRLTGVDPEHRQFDAAKSRLPGAEVVGAIRVAAEHGVVRRDQLGDASRLLLQKSSKGRERSRLFSRHRHLAASACPSRLAHDRIVAILGYWEVALFEACR
jgi:hypothetical protein